MSNSINDYVPSGLSKLKSKVKAAWLTALRGNRRQVRSALKNRRNDGRMGYCCLGVLCDLAEEEGIVFGEDSCSGNIVYEAFDDKDDTSSSFLPRVVKDWAELHANRPFAGQSSLIAMNDAGRTFKEIAAEIEEHL